MLARGHEQAARLQRAQKGDYNMQGESKGGKKCFWHMELLHIHRTSFFPLFISPLLHAIMVTFIKLTFFWGLETNGGANQFSIPTLITVGMLGLLDAWLGVTTLVIVVTTEQYLEPYHLINDKQSS